MDLWSHVVFYWWWSIGGFSSARSCQGSRILSIPTTARTHPYSTDGLALYDILHTYTEDYLSIFYSGESLVRDPAVRGWWQAIVSLAPTLGLGPQIGRVSPYLLDPAFPHLQDPCWIANVRHRGDGAGSGHISGHVEQLSTIADTSSHVRS